MRYRFAILPLIAVVPLMNLLDALAAPTPEPYAILDIGPPSRGETMEDYIQSEMRGFVHPFNSDWHDLWQDEEVHKLESVAAHEDSNPRRWLAESTRVTAIPQTRHLRFEFRGGDRSERVVILNTLLRIHVRKRAKTREWREKCLRQDEEVMSRLVPGTKTSEAWEVRLSQHRTFISAYKQIAVIQWAK